MKLFTSTLLAVLSFSAFAQTTRAADFNLAHGTSIDAYTVKATAIFEAETKDKVVYLRPGGMASDNILVAVDLGKIELGISGNSWDALKKIIEEKKTDVKNLAKIQTRVLGQDAILFITHKDGPKELSKEQLKKVLTGTVTNWKDVGGSDTPVQIVIPLNSPATQKTISQTVLDGGEILQRKAKLIDGSEAVEKFVASNKGAIGFVSPITPLSGAIQIKHPPISKPVTAITLGEPSAKAAKYMATLEKVLAGK